MDVIELVKRDHDRVEALFSKFKGGGGLTGLVRRVTGDVPPRQRRSAVDGICRELDVHARVEEEILYPAIRATRDPELGRLVTESLREHARLKKQVASLRARPEGQNLDARVAVLEKDVNHHVSEEEGEMLPRVEALLDASTRADLGRRMQARKRALAGAPAPRRAAAARQRAARSARGRRPRKTAGARRGKARRAG